MGEFGPWHLAIVAAVSVVLFGSERLPDAARSLGRSLRIFTAEMKALDDGADDTGTAPAERTATDTSTQPPTL